MIAQLRGTLVDKQADQIILDVGGVGYRLFIALSTYEKLPDLGSTVQLLTVTYVREDALHLYGFASQEEKTLFLLLNNVSGIGTRLAISSLSALSSHTLVQAIRNEDLNTLCLIPGVGRKTAQRLVIELKDRLPPQLLFAQTSPATDSASATTTSGSADAAENRMQMELISALINLGYKRQEVERVVGQLLRQTPSTTLSDGLRASLKLLARPVSE
ncbi:Holliday junction branch migration protein RuvA [Candidatus Magnetaquicoccus inordinatus]|uniref:Holliday junction branch migration protein RuvA n=1 Tax=Candidatus Magnetaquicoccus inordinatus TaxID=2496818 RepID=UPI00102AB822|nr:Holliday junction branch migration protein RuvA [Candidatus Magnetaquicoccus inordinatus]